MINDLINSILRNLEYYFPTDNKYVEDVEQGFQAPCFLVNVIGYDKTNLNESTRFYRESESIDLEIIYFPTEDKLRNTQKRQIAEITPKIVKAVERLELYNKQIRSKDIKTVIVDNTLEVLVSFNFNTVFRYKKQLMENLEQLKGGFVNETRRNVY